MPSSVDTSGVSNPAPQAVYQTERYGNFTYTLPGLKSGVPYTVRLHEAETYWTGSGQCSFNASINGQQVLSTFDIYAAAGGANKAIVEQFTTTADATGQITIQFTSVKDNAKVDGIEILAIMLKRFKANKRIPLVPAFSSMSNGHCISTRSCRNALTTRLLRSLRPINCLIGLKSGDQVT